jgi:hypothetical protein
MKTIKKELKRYDNLIESVKKVTIGDMTPFINELNRKRQLVASRIGKKDK